jgi:hypothetical protein
VPGYPNLFTLYGPNTNGVQSIIYILEVQTVFVRRLLDAMVSSGVQAVDVRQQVHDVYNSEIQAALAGTVWLAGCSNYFSHQSGKVVTQFPYHGAELAARLADVDLDHFTCQPFNGQRQEEADSCEESTILQ